MTFHEDNTLPTDLRTVLVFGSNMAGIHGAGAAKIAAEKFGAQRNVGFGRTGRSYAIPTKNYNMKPISLSQIAAYAGAFVQHARLRPTERFFVTRVGCGLAGFRDDQIAPLFKRVPSNCSMPEPWREYLG
jgi:hypothetical protein